MLDFHGSMFSIRVIYESELLFSGTWTIMTLSDPTTAFTLLLLLPRNRQQSLMAVSSLPDSIITTVTPVTIVRAIVTVAETQSSTTV